MAAQGLGAHDSPYTVWIPNQVSWRLGPADRMPCRYGGHRTMHELAVAIAATGRRVEIRGEVDVDELRLLADAARAPLPELPTEALRPGPGD